ncbi:HPr kinase/phosphorylase [Thioclava sp. GXIMD4215]|uniref:HPr kinase/phosphorylase n=1 Tax=Thioclava sp. GXIMD4215 TaxID=3131928 RepID=UPI00324FD629
MSVRHNLHASCVALDAQHAVLIMGASGSGKSTLALRLMAFGAHLVADDRTDLRCESGQILASAPLAIRGRIEARGVGILSADALSDAILSLVVDLDRIETERLPPQRNISLYGVSLPLVLQAQHSHLDAAIWQFLKAGRVA